MSVSRENAKMQFVCFQYSRADYGDRKSGQNGEQKETAHPRDEIETRK